MQQLTGTAQRLLRVMPKHDFIYLRELAKKIDLSSVHTQKVVRELEERGYLKIAEKSYRTEPLRISLNAKSIESIKPDFDNLLFHTRWA